VTTDVSTKVALIQPLLSQLLVVVKGTLGELVAYAVPTVVGTVSDTEDMTVEELGQLLREVEEEVSKVLGLVVTLIGNLYPAVAAIIQLIM
jgi:malonyl CoA-acyl carrier protein transacylase